MKYLEKKYDKLRHTTIKPNKFIHGKKLALTIGIKSAKHEHLLLTDADTYPASKEWIKKIISKFSEQKEIIISYGAFEQNSGLINKLIRYDNAFNSIQYLSFAKAGIPYMATGRNLAYKKSLFIKNKGFASHYGILSGDDDLFVNENATPTNTNICISPKAFTYTKAETTFKNWYYQKLRHLTTSHKYKTLHKFLLIMEPLSRMLFYSSILLSILYTNTVSISILTLAFLVKIFVLNFTLKTLKEKDLFLYSLMFDLILPMLYLIIHINKLIKQQEWK